MVRDEAGMLKLAQLNGRFPDEGNQIEQRNLMAKKAVVGLVNDETEVPDVMEGLQAAGFSSEEVSVLIPDQNGGEGMAQEKRTKAPEGAGPLIAAGPLMAALSGAAAGGIAEALMGMGIPELEARRYEERVKEGNVLISVHTEDAEQAQHARDILEHGGAEDISMAEEASVKPNAPPRVRVRLATPKPPAKENETA